ncbi:O-antigen ligase family protein [Rubritalea marina]|uniref:O-antigen ligase family protein n=1 Tax=Rubritalea marina TaxID=361055 RepID=UPI0003758C3D|nr:O-antigen ligase family protein [Rubritalea marina]
MRRVLHALLAIFLFIGPLNMGSYWGNYRWPLLILATLYGVLAIALPRRSLMGQDSNVRLNRVWWVLAGLLIALGVQGGWMWFNAKSTFYFNEVHEGVHYWWELLPREGVPFPDFPGAPDRGEAWDRLSYLIPCGLVFLGTLRLLHLKVLSMRYIVACIFWAGVAVATLGLAQRMTGASGIYWNPEFSWSNRHLFFATFRSPAIAAAYLNLCFSVGFGYLIATVDRASKSENASPWRTVSVLIGLIVVFAGAVAAGSKAGVFFAVLSLLLWIVFGWRMILTAYRRASSILPSGSPHERNIILLATVGAGCFAALSFSNIVADRWGRSIHNDYGTMQIRVELNKIQWKMVHEPDFGAVGYGPGSFYPMFEIRKNQNLVDGLQHHYYVYAHNDHFQTLLEWGYWGFFIYLSFFIGALVLCIRALAQRRRKMRTTKQAIYLSAAIGIGIMFTHAWVDFPLQIESIAITLACVLAVTWSSLRVG